MRALKRSRTTPEAGQGRRDPSPSRFAYRLHRLWLTPLVRALLRTGLPAFAVVGFVAVYLSDDENRAAIAMRLSDLREAVEQRPEFMVTEMAIEGVTPEIRDALAAHGPSRFPVSSFDLDLAALKRTFEAFDVVRRADLRVGADGVLRVEIVQRLPALVWRRGSELLLVDAEGHRIARLSRRSARADLPLIAGAGAAARAPEALELIAAAGPVSDRLRGLVRVGERRWDVVLDRDQRIRLPEEGAVAALERVLALDRARDLLARDVRSIDMRIAERPTVRLAAGAVTELKRIRRIERGEAN